MTREYLSIIRITMFLSIVALSQVAIANDNEWQCNGPQGGTVKTIIVHPEESNTVLIGTIVNGIYKSLDNGTNWDHLESSVLHNTLREIHFHPITPDTVYAATAGGLFKSNNNGDDWYQISPPSSWNCELRSLAIHPTDPNIIITGGPMNEWITFDNGQSWQRPGIPSNIGISSIAIDTHHPDTIYIVASGFAYGLGIWKSEDRAQTWTNIQNNIDTVGYGSDIEIDPNNSDIIYLSRKVYEQPPNTECLSKSINGGDDWINITPDILTAPEISHIKVLPSNSNVLFICTSYDGVLKSIDAGDTWYQINNGLSQSKLATIEIDTTNSILYLGTYHDGIYKSIDEGESWQRISYNLNCAAIFDLAVSDFDQNISIAAANNGLFFSDNMGESWESIDIGCPPENIIFTVSLDRYNQDYIYCASAYENWYIQPSRGFYRSINGGDDWDFFNEGFAEDANFTDMNISYYSSDDRRIFLASDNGLYFSDDLGENWSICSNGIPTNRYILVVEVASSNPDVVAIGDDENDVYISLDRGDSWHQAADLPEHPRHEYVIDIEFDPTDKNHIFAGSCYLGLFESIDGGENWNEINNDLPLEESPAVVSGITINPHNPLNIFVASNHYGIYQTHNGGQTWESFNAGMDTTHGVGEMMFASNDTTKLYFASESRSVWTINRTPTGITNKDNLLPSKLSVSAYPNPFNAATRIEFTLPEAGEITADIYDILGRHVATVIDDYLFPGHHSVVWSPEGIATGQYYLRLSNQEITSGRKLLYLK